MEQTTAASTHKVFRSLYAHLNKRIIGQEALTARMLIALLCEGHLLVEGAPGLAKTTAIKALSKCIEANFQRIQFTPDLLPGDITGTEIFKPADASFEFQKGPLFHNLILADEINRASAKVQSALLEAMGERQITVGKQTYALPPLFMVMATQNPIEHEGTYQLPEAQLDRFLLYVKIDYPQLEQEREILQLVRAQTTAQLDDKANTQISPIPESVIAQARRDIFDVHLTKPLEEYIVQIIMTTRNPSAYNESWGNWIAFGASPRATIALDRAARAHAWLAGRDYVTPDDIQAIAPDILRHRIVLTFEAQASGVTSDQIIAELLQHVAVP